MRRYDLIIFDLDGTLLDTLADLCEASSYALKKNGLEPYSQGEIRMMVGKGLSDLAKVMTEKRGEPSLKDPVYRDLVGYYSKYFDVYTRPYPGVEKTLLKLKEKGYILTVLSNKKEEITKKLIESHFEGMFDLVLGQTEGRRLKPDPAGVEYIGKQFGKDADRMLIVGDSAVDHETAKRAGADCIILTCGFCGREALSGQGIKNTADDFADIYDIIEEYNDI